MDTDRYCIRNFKGEYITHQVNLSAGTDSFFFTPSSWMAYLFTGIEDARNIAAEEGGLVMRWENGAGGRHV